MTVAMTVATAIPLAAAGGSGSGGPPEYSTVAEVALLFRVSAKHIYDLCSRGEIPCTRLGRTVRFSRADLDDIRRICRSGPPGPAA